MSLNSGNDDITIPSIEKDLPKSSDYSLKIISFVDARVTAYSKGVTASTIGRMGDSRELAEDYCLDCEASAFGSPVPDVPIGIRSIRSLTRVARNASAFSGSLRCGAD
jgi:hypothetical protein